MTSDHGGEVVTDKRLGVALILMIFLTAIALMSIKTPRTSGVSMMLSKNMESAKVSEILKGKGNVGGSTIFIVNTRESYRSLPPTFYKDIHSLLKSKGFNVTMDYYLLKDKLNETITKGIVSYVKDYYKYISYLKSLVNQLDAVSFYVIGALEDAWRLKLFLSKVPQLYNLTYEKSLLSISKINNFEDEFYKNEQTVMFKAALARYKVNNLMSEMKRTYELFLKANEALTQLYNLFKIALKEQCSNGTISIRQVNEFLSSKAKGLAKHMVPVFSNAVLDTALAWPGNLTKICKSESDMNYFIMQVLARFISLAPDQLKNEMSAKFSLTPSQSKTLLTLALSIGPGVNKGIMESALAEAFRVLFKLTSATASEFLNAINGDKAAYASLVVYFSGVREPCMVEALFNSIISNTSLSIELRRCELNGVKQILDTYAPKPYDPIVIEASLASRGLSKEWAKYLTFYSLYNALRAKSLPPNLAFEIAWSGEVKNMTNVIFMYLNSSGVLYASDIAKAVVFSKDFEHARRMALMFVFSKFAKEMEAGGLSEEAVSTLINYLLAWSPGLTSKMVNEIVYKTVLIELRYRGKENPLFGLFSKLVNVDAFTKNLVYCENVSCAINVARKYSTIATTSFIQKYVTLDILVGKHGYHLIISTNFNGSVSLIPSIKRELSKLGPVREVYATGQKLLNSDIQRSITRSMDEINKIATIFVLLALLFSTRSLKLSIIPVIIIYIVLQYYKALVFVVYSLFHVAPSSVDLIVATATILGMGIDYSLYAASRFAKERSIRKAIKPVLIASSMASTGFIIFGALSLFLLPSLASLGLFIPLAIMFTATVGPLLTFTIVSLLKIKEEDVPRRVPLLTSLSIEFPKLTIILGIILAAVSLYILLLAPPGYDLFLFLPPNAPSVQGLKVLQAYSSPGITGPTIVLLKLKPQANLTIAAKQVEALAQYFLESGFFDHAFTITRPLGKFISYDPKVFKVAGGDNFIKGDYIVLYLLPHYPPDSNKMIEYVKVMRAFLKNWLEKRGSAFSSTLVGGESAMNYDLSVITNKIILNYILPSMIIIMSTVLIITFRRPEFITASILGTVVPMALALGLSTAVFKAGFHIPLLWIVVPLLVTTVLSVGSDYLVFYLFGIKEGMEECKIVMDGECLEKLSVLLYSSAKLSSLILGFATTFAVAYYSLIVSNIWALRQIGLALGTSAILLFVAIAYTLVPASLSLAYRRR